MAWKKWRGHAESRDFKPTHIDYLIGFIGTAGSTAPSPGVTITSIDAAATALPSTGLIAEPMAVQVVDRKRTTEGNDALNILFRGFYTET